jgi:hypothetical protein
MVMKSVYMSLPPKTTLEGTSGGVIVSMRSPARRFGSGGSSSRFDANSCQRSFSGTPVQERVRKKFESRQATVMARRTFG